MPNTGAACTGETLGDYLRRRRVEVAAMRLAAQPRSRVLDLALSVGFGSAEAFTRAFKTRFGCSPTAWRAQQATLRRANRNSGQAFSAPFTQHEVFQNPNKETLMNVKIMDRQSATVAYLRHLGPYGPAIGHFWQEVYVPWAVMNRLGPDHARYGIGHDDLGITAPEQCRYDACATGCLPAVCNWMRGRALSTIRRVPHSTRRTGCSNARSVFPSFPCEGCFCYFSRAITRRTMDALMEEFWL